MEEKQHIGKLFDRIAPTYDGLNHFFSLNIDRYWRRKAVKQMQSAAHVLDVAIGTADLTIEMLRRGKAQHVTGIDLSDEMMGIGKMKVEGLRLNGERMNGERVSFLHANAQQMPFEDAVFDGVTCAYGCRNFSDLDAGLNEMYRVLKQGGEVMIIEFSYPSNPLMRALYDMYFSHVMPWVGRMVSKDKTAYTYLNKSVKGFCWGEAFLDHLRKAGFKNVKSQTMTFGICSVYFGSKD